MGDQPKVPSVHAARVSQAGYGTDVTVISLG